MVPFDGPTVEPSASALETFVEFVRIDWLPVVVTVAEEDMSTKASLSATSVLEASAPATSTLPSAVPALSFVASVGLLVRSLGVLSFFFAPP